MNQPLIDIRHLNVTYFPGKSNEVKALQDVNLSINPGEFIVFFGPSGCGKSTLLYSLAGLETHITGDVVVEGQNIRTMSQKQLEHYHQRTIGMIFQSFYLISSLTVLENVALPQVAIRAKRHEREKRAQELLDHFGVGAQSRKLPTELSGGQQQRVAISRSLVNEPTILVADEPVGNLDSKSSQDVMELLRKLNDEQKKTVILVTHDPSHLHYAHCVFYLRDGKIVNVQRNSEEDRKRSPVEQAAQTSGLEHWVKTMVVPEAAKGQALEAARRAQALLTEVLTGLPVAEVENLQNQLYRFLLKEENLDAEKLQAYLDSEVFGGRHDVHRQQTLRRMADLRSLLILLLEIEHSAPGPDGRLRAIRDYLLGSVGAEPEPILHVSMVDRLIADRLSRKISATEFVDGLALPFPMGAQLDLDQASTASHRLEAVLNLLSSWLDHKKPLAQESSAPEHT